MMKTNKSLFVVCVFIAVIINALPDRVSSASPKQIYSPNETVTTADDQAENGTVSFTDDSSALSIFRKASANKIHHLEFLFRTTLSRCAIALGEGDVEDKTSFSLRMEGGKLRPYSFWHDDLKVTVGENLNDGKWHKAVVSLNGSHFTLEADGEIVPWATPPLENQTGVNYLLMGFQGTRRHLGKYGSGGCIKNLQINGKRLMLDGTDNADYRVSMRNLKVGEDCVKVEQCHETSCQNGGKCIDLWRVFECQCPRTHHGATCQYLFIAAVFNHEESPNSLAFVDIPPERIWNTAVISMVLRTTTNQGTIFFLGNKSHGKNGNYMEAVINDEGKLLVHRKWDSDGGKVESEDYHFVVNDGKARLIQVWCSRDSFEMSVDGSTVIKQAFSTGAFNATVMYIGGIPASLTTGGQNGVAKTTGSKYSGGGSNLFVSEKDRFIGTIRDVSVRLSLDPDYNGVEDKQGDASKSTVYSVHLFNATQEHTENGGQLGRVTTQNLKMQTLSDQDDYSPCGVEYYCRPGWYC